MSEPVRIGFYVCHCGTNIAATIDVDAVAKYAAKLPNVAVSRNYKYMCSDPGQELIQQDIREHKLNRVVVAACSPLLHERTFRNATMKGGLSPFFFQMVNIREHNAWVHTDGAEATRKALALVRAAIARVPLHKPLEIKKVPIHPDVLIVGGGIAGIHAALTLADGGKKVTLVEREATIGGHSTPVTLSASSNSVGSIACPARLMRRYHTPASGKVQVTRYIESSRAIAGRMPVSAWDVT